MTSYQNAPVSLWSCPSCGPPTEPTNVAITVDVYPGVLAATDVVRIYRPRGRVWGLGTTLYPVTFLAATSPVPVIPSPPGDYLLTGPQLPFSELGFNADQTSAWVQNTTSANMMMKAEAQIVGSKYRSYVHGSGGATPPAVCNNPNRPVAYHTEWLYLCEADIP